MLSLIGCSDTTQSEVKTPVSSLNQAQTSFQKNQSEDDVIAAFKKSKEYRDYEILDYVVVKDDKLPLLTAVISYYDPIENNSCNLAFIYGDTIQRIGFAVNEIEGVKTYEIADDRRLAYIGNGAVSTSIRKIDTNELINYKISFSYDDQTLTTDIKVESEKPKNESLY